MDVGEKKERGIGSIFYASNGVKYATINISP